MDESRKAFESWVVEWWLQAKGNICRDGEGYSNNFMEYAWSGWKASRSNIEIELPEVCAWNLCELLDKKEVIEAIRAAGIKVKE
ncbi:hypothetical protein [Pluralibacter sp.]|uniref:hypothetical protein n=1 Tax=Pluralibacter sp. TaxID=1920032 RepID=UPI0025CECF4A|nr:hypothetical protein [Pluralibacter sp.]